MPINLLKEQTVLDQPKKTYYISVGAGEILSVPNASPWEFKIEANDDEITRLREIFDSNQDNSIDDFLRAHVPFVEYSHDPTNDQHDQNLYRVYNMIYELGDQEAKQHIESMGILDGFKSE
ncbi:hydrolase [Bacillus sp. Sa1BUA2]|uniref:Hydrolase n=2 Tax=Bacillus norwichensis TaxID=2762217 RepID=A0ABR8VRG8_9BACI|nr:hydrolase [Bacillus norwichensis]